MQKPYLVVLALSGLGLWASGCPNAWEGGDPAATDEEENVREVELAAGGCNPAIDAGCNDWKNRFNNTFDLGFNAGYSDCSAASLQGYNYAWNASWNDAYHLHPIHSNDPDIHTKAWKSDEWAKAFDGTFSSVWSNGWVIPAHTSVWVESRTTHPSPPHSSRSLCEHPITRAGGAATGALTSSCSPLVQATCATTPSCCQSGSTWTIGCMDAAIARAENNSGNTNAHHVLDQGGPLAVGAAGTCTEAVCNSRAYCCTNQWDASCVESAAQLCYARYIKNVRVGGGSTEASKRIMLTICIDPYLKDLGANNTNTGPDGTPNNPTYCPLAKGEDNTYSGQGRECCRRAMAMSGSYRVQDVQTSGPYAYQGRVATWEASREITLSDGATTMVNSTIVPDHVIRLRNGSVVMTEMHHLWQIAGAEQFRGPTPWFPGGTMYADCSGPAGTPRPCNNFGNGDGQNGMLDTSHTKYFPTFHGTPVRAMATASLSALTTTSSKHMVDIRWSDDVSSTYMPNHAGWDIGQAGATGTNTVALEAGWAMGQYWYGGNAWEGWPTCVSQSSRQRGTTLTSNLASCNAIEDASSYLKTHHDLDN